ncbi:MAG TPA: ABC transporter permease [Pseudolysinimonas sp.]|nr:ABC transporter permease [Pseudolysinimonas sp.]
MSQSTIAIATTPTVPTPRGRVRLFRAARRRPLLITGLVIVLAWIAVAALADLIAPYDPLSQAFVPLTPPSPEHLFGTDNLGRDTLSRVIHGSRISVTLSFALVGASMLIGGTIGLISGFFGGWVDELLMRIVDLFFAFPVIILAMAVAASLGANLQNSVLAGVVVSWPMYARTVRGLVVGLRESEFVQASRLAGVSSPRSIAVDIIPSIAGPTFVLATQELGSAILLLSGLSFLGLGAQPPLPEWGATIAAGTTYFAAWWIAVFPGLAIMSLAFAANLLGDGLRDAFDPRSGRSGR